MMKGMAKMWLLYCWNAHAHYPLAGQRTSKKNGGGVGWQEGSGGVCQEESGEPGYPGDGGRHEVAIC